ncbi:hypothetical protein CF326_g5294 [Tilletia indica]|nr:hypothetical protein CF326_g5294 [Tilletia indica]
MVPDHQTVFVASPSGPVLPPSPLLNLTFSTLNCGSGGLRARLREFAPSARGLLATSDVICLQECNLRNPILPAETEALRAFLGPSHSAAITALLTRDTGIILRSPSLVIESFAYGSRWCRILVSLPPPPAAEPPFPPPVLLSIFSIHGPFRRPQWGPIHEAVAACHPDLSIPCLLGADWNSIPDLILDSSNARPTNTPWAVPAAFLDPLQLTDTFRALHPADPGWTYFRITRSPSGPVLSSARRLDTILCSAPLLSALSSSESVHTSSDHRAVVTRFGPAPPDPPAREPDPASWHFTWALHPGLWQSSAFTEAVRTFGTLYTPTHDLSALTPSQAWKLFAHATREHLHALSITYGASQRLLLDQLASVSAALDAVDCRSASDMAALPGLLHQYRAALSALELALALPFSSRLAAAELRLSSWLASAASSPRTTPLPDLLYDGVLCTTPDAKLGAIQSYFSSLYTPSPLPLTFETDCASLFHHLISALPLPVTARLAEPFTADEVSSALRFANRRASAGPDGLPYRVWVELLPVAGPLLADLANDLGSGAPLEVQARSVILPKTGDLSDLGNYRNISISNSFVRTLARMLSARLLSAAEHLLPWNQAAFLPGRRTTLVSGILQGLTDLAASPSPLSPSAFIVISLDQRKAYDRVRHEWLFACLRSLGLPDLLLRLLGALYAAASTRFSTADGISGLIRFLSGVLQGDPSSCIIYNLTLQPLLDLLRAWGVGIFVPGLGFLTSLAFADDVLFFLSASAHGLRQWHALCAALALYQRASNAEVNIAKSSFWLVGAPAPADMAATMDLVASLAASGLTCTNDRPFLVHLGHPISLSPAPPLEAIVARFAAIRARALCFPTLGVSLLTRVQKSKQFLTSRLWHSISLGALPTNFSDLYFAALAPYLFAPTTPYISRSDMTLPRPLGGLGLLNPDHMATALSISFLRRYLCEDGPVGQWLRLGLTTELRRRVASPPALLLVRSGPSFTTLQHADMRAEGLFGRLLHALASVDLGISSDWTSLPAQALLTLPWLTAFPSLGLSDQRLVTYTRTGWITLGDLLWLGPLPDYSVPLQASLGPPPPFSVSCNGRPLPYAPRLPGGVPGLPWDDLLSTLPARVSATLRAYSRSGPPSIHLPGPFSLEEFARRPSSASWLPLAQDPNYGAFPWHLLTVGGRPLLAASPASVRRSLTPSTPRAPRWTFPAPAPSSFWIQVWDELDDSPLTADLRSACLLVLGRNLWTYRAKDALCPAGCPVPDSPTHGVCACPEALMVWHACLPLLRALGVSAPLVFTPYNIVGAWPDLRSLRPRLTLWRSVVLATLHTARVIAGRDARATACRPDFRHCSSMDVLSHATAALVSCLTAAWDRLAPSSPAVPRFRARWLAGASLLREDVSSLVACPVTASPGQPMPIPAPQLLPYGSPVSCSLPSLPRSALFPA